MPTGSVTYKIFEETFICNTIKKLIDCIDNSIYYTSDALSFGGTPIVTGNTFTAKLLTSNGFQTRCITYDSDVDGSSTTTIQSVLSVVADCGSCNVTPTPTVTPTITPTPSSTPSPTPTPSASAGLVYVFSACTGVNRQIIQPMSVLGVSVGNTIKYNNECWSYMGAFVSPYIPTSGIQSFNYSTNVFGVPSTVYANCSSCVAQPIPTPTFRSHNVVWAWNSDCPICDIANGTPITVYTDYATSVLQNNSVIYTNSALTIPFASGRKIKSNNSVFSVNTGGVLILECIVGGPC